ncbi:MAG TPA: Fic family protein [Acidimicrobiales bacterium]|nr:Fic family protein [Acidimicrobiales bacterium]
MATNQPRPPTRTPTGDRFNNATPDSQLELASSAELQVPVTGWPHLTYEEHRWVPSAPDAGSRRQQLAARGPYEAAVLQPIAGIEEIPLSLDTRALVTEATAEIARFDTEMGSEIAPFASILLRSESAASSKIENLTASARSIALAELGNTSKRNASIIVSNVRAMQAAIDLADRLNQDAILAMHAALLGDSDPGIVGRWRTQQVWIGGSDYSPHGAAFVPPHYDRVPAAMDDLIAFLSREDIETLAQAAVAHAQFETIHPFPDGNGRVGRAMVHSLMRSKRITRNVTIPVSAGLLTNLDSYFDALTEYRLGRPEPIVRLMAEASFSSIANGRALVSDLRSVRDHWGERIHARSDAAAWKVVDILMAQPVIDSPAVQERLGIPVMSANRAIERLVRDRVLKEVTGRYRDRVYEAKEVLVALDGFAARGSRRASEHSRGQGER